MHSTYIIQVHTWYILLVPSTRCSAVLVAPAARHYWPVPLASPLAAQQALVSAAPPRSRPRPARLSPPRLPPELPPFPPNPVISIHFLFLLLPLILVAFLRCPHSSRSFPDTFSCSTPRRSFTVRFASRARAITAAPVPVSHGHFFRFARFCACRPTQPIRRSLPSMP